jgi:hypothetical protein
MRFPGSMLAIFLALVPSTILWGRVWTNRDGVEIEAEMVSATDTEVVLLLENGQTAKVPLEKLSQADRDHVAAAKSGPRAAEPGPNWDSPWPDVIRFGGDPEIRIVEENESENRWVYESAHFRFICDVRLAKSVVSGFAEMFEATRELCRALPIGLDGGWLHDGKYDISLVETAESYAKAGGPPDSGGFFDPNTGVVHAPLTSLGVRKVGSGYMRDRAKNDQTLVHELVHQLTPPPYYTGETAWFTEGIAEYCANTPYGNGRFTVRKAMDKAIRNATGYDDDTMEGRAIGEQVAAPDLKTFMTMPYGEFSGENGNFNYGLGTLLTVYFIHLDGEGDAARLKSFLKALRAGDANPLDRLLDGRSWDELESDVSKAIKREGVEITFG